VLACTLALGLPASSSASVTIGSSMATPGNAGVGCGATPCTFSQSALPGQLVTSPVNGTVTVWRIQATGAGSFRFRVLRPMVGGPLFAASSASQPVPGQGTYSFPTSLPISIGDRIGLDQGDASTSILFLAGVTGATGDSWQPVPGDGAQLPPSGSFLAGDELMLNADVEPTSTFTLTKPTTLKKGRARLTATLPNPGTLTVSGRLMKPQTLQATDAPGQFSLTMKPSKASKKRLKRKGKAKGGVSLTYTPDFGNPAVQPLKLKLRRG
jgi:hypothetical protein